MGKLINDVFKPIEQDRPFLTKVLKIQVLTSRLDLELHEQIAGNITNNKEALNVIEIIEDEINSLKIENVHQQGVKEYVGYFKEHLKQLKAALNYHVKMQMLDPNDSSDEEIFEIIKLSLTEINENLSDTIVTLREHIYQSDLKIIERLQFARIALFTIFTTVILGSIATLFILNKGISNNLRKLLEMASMLTKGHLKWRINSKSNDQFGRLSHALDKMAEEIESSNKQIITQTSKIKTLACHDTLTNLPNRHTFLTHLNEEVEKASSKKVNFAVLFINLDNFKNVNDLYGHDIGDLLLKEVARRLKKHISLSDTVARLGGDEFTILLSQPELSTNSTTVINKDSDALSRPVDISNKIVDELNQPFLLENHSVSISPSIGISIYPDNGKTAEDILKNSDTAMYAAKAQGKNCFIFCSSEMTNRVQQLLQKEKELRKAIINDEFVLYYQPQLDLSDGTYSGLEALVRWIHPEKGFIPPNDFIPLAEERGLITDITKWVLKTACRQQKAWQEAGYKQLPIMVNLSAKDFYQQDISEIIAQQIADANINPSLIGIEVTETSVMENRAHAIKTLLAIKEMGINVALDDFGTGYSSLNYLKSLPIDLVKVDRSFIFNITKDKKNAAIMQAIIAMSHTLGLNVLVEGVENHEQNNFIKELGCDYVQGFLFSKPLSMEETTKVLTKI